MWDGVDTVFKKPFVGLFYGFYALLGCGVVELVEGVVGRWVEEVYSWCCYGRIRRVYEVEFVLFGVEELAEGCYTVLAGDSGAFSLRILIQPRIRNITELSYRIVMQRFWHSCLSHVDTETAWRLGLKLRL